MSHTEPKQTAIPHANRGAVLPTIHVPCPASEIPTRLESAARRGKFAGFVPGDRDVLFRVRDFGSPFESELIALAPAASPDSPPLPTTTLHFKLRLRTGLAWVYLGALIATVWPGVWLTDSMLRTYFTGYDYKTWMWYLPLTVPVVPWAMWASIHKSRRKGREAVAGVLDTIARTLGGRIDGHNGGASPSAAHTPQPAARDAVGAA